MSTANKNNVGFLNLAVLVLTIYVLGALIADTFLQLSEQTSKLLQYIDFAICIFFIIEFFYRLFKAEHKLNFLKWGWIDLLASIPMLDFLRFGRILRLIRLIRVLRAFKSVHAFLNTVFLNKTQGTMTTVGVLTILVIIFSSIAILEVENDAESNIQTAEDAIWWTYCTITTVGYGDKFPVTSEGRVLAMLLMTFGVGVFGTFTAFVASKFVENKNKEYQTNT
jgi:voltage-gated potassium channel